MKEIIRTVIFITLISILIVSCLNSDPRVEGQYIAAPGVELENVKLQFTLIDKNNKNYRYFVKLKENGRFGFSVQQRGEYMLTVSVNDYSREYWKEPILSNRNEFYFYNFQDNEITRLEDLYITDVIDLINPRSNEKFSMPDEIIFEWEEVHLADFYDLFISKIDKSGEVTPLTGSRVRNNKISYS